MSDSGASGGDIDPRRGDLLRFAVHARDAGRASRNRFFGGAAGAWAVELFVKAEGAPVFPGRLLRVFSAGGAGDFSTGVAAHSRRVGKSPTVRDGARTAREH